jgi:hypothetical protein
MTRTIPLGQAVGQGSHPTLHFAKGFIGRGVRRIFLIPVLVSPALAGAPAFAKTLPQASVTAQRFSAAELAQLKRVSTYLNSVKNVEGRCMQVSASSAADAGTFYLRKPGRVRF